MHAIYEAKKEITRLLKTALEKTYAPSVDELETPPDAKMGDFAFPCFDIAKALKGNPAEIASEIAAKIGPGKLIGSAEAKGPYVNFFIKIAAFGNEVLEEIEEAGEAYGMSDIGKNKKVMIEYANLNTHKDVHVGHLRNLFVGHMAVNVMKASGYDVIPVAYINDLGKHVAACLWALRRHADEEPPKDERIRFLQEMYVEAVAALEKDEAVKKEISQIHLDLEEMKGDYLAEWKKTRKWSIDQLKAVYKEFHLSLDTWYFESEMISATKKIIEDLIAKGIIVHSDGAWIVDLQDQNLGVNLLVKSDGALLYNAKDLALAKKKEKDFAPDWSIYVVDNRQSHALRQLFATLKKMGFDSKLTHLSYDFVTLKEGAMSSRKGNIIRFEDFRDEALRLATEETKKRHADWSKKKVEDVSSAVVYAAMRFGMLRTDPEKLVVFDMDELMSFDGFTGPYLLYTNARIKSIFRKAGRKAATVSADRLKSDIEHRLIVQLAMYPSILMETSHDFNLARLAQYLFDLAKIFSTFYNDIPILQAEDEKDVSARLGLIKAVSQVLENGLNIMGIEAVEEM